MAADSGAYDHVAKEEEFQGYSVADSEMSKRGESYVGAGGDDIKNLGQVSAECQMENGQEGHITVQKAKVRRNLASISKMVQAGNRVVFDQDYGVNTSYMLHKKTGYTSPIRHNGIFEFDIWVKDKSKVPLHNKYDELAIEEEPPTPGNEEKSARVRGKVKFCESRCGPKCGGYDCPQGFHRRT